MGDLVSESNTERKYIMSDSASLGWGEGKEGGGSSRLDIPGHPTHTKNH